MLAGKCFVFIKRQIRKLQVYDCFSKKIVGPMHLPSVQGPYDVSEKSISHLSRESSSIRQGFLKLKPGWLWNSKRAWKDEVPGPCTPAGLSFFGHKACSSGIIIAPVSVYILHSDRSFCADGLAGSEQLYA